MTVNEKIFALRQQMLKEGFDAYIMPSSDPHQSEYVADHFKSRQWLSGFMGSMGYLVVTQQHAGVWTDSRYFLQCETEIHGTDFVMHKQGIQGAPEHIDWLVQTLAPNSRVGCDGTLFAIGQVRAMQKTFSAKNIFLNTDIDAINAIWLDRPTLPTAPIFEHELVFAGKTRTEKLEDIRHKMRENGATLHLVTTIDDIGWTLNLRGSDVDCNPVFLSYLVIGLERCELFVNVSKLPETLKNTLNTEGVIVHAYEGIEAFLSKLKATDCIAVDGSNINYKLYSTIKQAKIIEIETFSIIMKAIKNETEQAWIRQVMVKDGVALLKAFRWLSKKLSLNETVTEYEFSAMIAQFRSDQAHYFGESFDAIVGYNGNGAIIHYKPAVKTSAVIEPNGILLVDSGGQYADGTTDITRTISLDGKPKQEIIDDFTAVLKGHIAIAELIFPQGTKGIQMDILARMYLWKASLNYGHGTGHGVGFFMNVHEPPQGIAPALNSRGTTPHQLGMLTSNEPGMYREGSYGIRIENLILVVPHNTNTYGTFYKFETVTLFPLDRSLINKKMLTKSEITWINDYHQRVFSSLEPHLDTAEKTWLKQECKKI